MVVVRKSRRSDLDGDFEQESMMEGPDDGEG